MDKDQSTLPDDERSITQNSEPSHDKNLPIMLPIYLYLTNSALLQLQKKSNI